MFTKGKLSVSRVCLLLLAGLFLLLLLCGCSPEQQTPQPNNLSPTVTLSCSDIVARVAAAQPFNGQVVLSRSVMIKYLLIDEAWIADGSMSMDGSRVTAEQIIALTARDDASLALIKTALDQYLRDYTEEYRDYQPAELPKLQSAVTREHGLDIALIVSADAAAAASALDQIWKP